MESTDDYESILKLIDIIFWSTGFQLFDGLWDMKYRRIQRGLILGLYGMAPILPIIFVLHNFSTGTLDSRVRSVTDTVLCFQTVFKLLFLYYNHKNLVNLFQISREFRAKYSQDVNCVGFISRYTYITKITHRVTVIAYFMCVSFYGILPIANGEYKEYILPLAYNLPFMAVDGMGHYMINYVYQTFALSCMYIFSTGLDGLFFLSIADICVQLGSLTEKLRTLGVKLNGESLDPDELRVIHNLHLDFLSYMDSVKNMNANLVLIQLATDCIFLCTFMYTLTKSDDMARLPITIVCLLSAAFQLFTYCLCGQIVTDKVNELTTTMYDNEWYNLTLKDQKSFVIIMSRSQQDVYIGALGFNLSLENFVSVMKTAYSYYTIMRNMDG